MTSTAAAMPSSGMAMGREKSFKNGSGAALVAGASLPRSFLIGLFRIWKGDSASLHAARATRHREHLCGFVGPFPRGVVLVMWRRGAFTTRAGARGDPAVQAGRRVRRAAAARRPTPLQRRRRHGSSRAAPLVLREAAFPGSERRRRGQGTNAFVCSVSPHASFSGQQMPVARSRSAASIE